MYYYFTYFNISVISNVEPFMALDFGGCNFCSLLSSCWCSFVKLSL